MSLFKYTERAENQKDTRPVEVRQQELYDLGCQQLRNATNESMYQEAAVTFESIPGYPAYGDAAHKAARCYEMAEVARKDAIFNLAAALLRRGKLEDVQKSMELYQSIPGWKNADRDVVACQQALERLKREEEARLEAERQKQAAVRAKREKQLAIVKKAAWILLLIAAVAFALYTVVDTAITLNRDQCGKRLFGKVPEVGDIITLGRFEQDNVGGNGAEPIEWIVVDKQHGKLLVTSRYILESRPYNKKQKGINWADCTLRTWLNNDFLNTAFTEEERQLICDTELVNADHELIYNYNPIVVDGGPDTVDKIFLLSKENARTCLPERDDRQILATPYAAARGAGVNEDGYAWWWLRDPGGFSTYAATVSYTGSVLDYGDNVEFILGGVRPAFWLDAAQAVDQDK